MSYNLKNHMHMQVLEFSANRVSVYCKKCKISHWKKCTSKNLSIEDNVTKWHFDFASEKQFMETLMEKL